MRPNIIYLMADELGYATGGFGKWGNTKAAQEIKWPPTKGRYVLLHALSELDGNAFASLAELGIR